MINISFEKNPNLYTNYLDCLNFLAQIKNKDFEYPSEKINFHIYSEFRTDKEIVSLMSFFATQNLEKTKVIVWSDYDIRNEPRIQRFKDLVDFRVWDAKSEAVGTPIEKELRMFKAADEKHYLQSDLLRLLALYKYGGVWIDMDIVLLRDFKPLLDQEYMYMWGSETDFKNQGACATVLSLKKESEFSIKLLEEATKMPIIPNSTCWGKDMFAQLYRHYNFNIMPASFFNIEWCINKHTPGLGDHIEAGWFKSRSDNKKFMFLDSFAWHWHNSSKKNLVIEPDSKFKLLTELTESRLKERGL
jgi:hypothetical protein